MALASTKEARKQEFEVRSENCSGCRYCQLACSFRKTGSFGWADALINVRRVDGKERYQVDFAAGCDECGFCAKYCYFGVLGENKTEGKGQ